VSSWLPRFASSRKTRAPPGFCTRPTGAGDIKRKLVWAAQHFYLFRQFARYLEEQKTGTTDVNAIDDFICQHCTDWCGLGLIDLFAAALGL